MAELSSILGSAGIGGAIGKAIVSLELETKKYQAELKAAEAQTAASSNAMGTSVSKFGSLASTAFKIFGVAAVAGLAVSVKAAIEADAALLKLQNTYDNNAKLADVSVESFQAQAEALQLLTGSSDEAILSAQALLGQFDVTGKQVQELIPLIVDLSAKLGIDMDAAAKSVGKAVIGNTAGLQRYGIVIKEASGAGGEFDAVLKGLQGTVSGFAEARAQAEPWRVLAAQFDELAEDVGHALIPILQDLAKEVQNLVPVLQFAADHLASLVVAGSAIFLWVKWPAIIGAVTTAFGALQLVLDSVTVSAIGATTALGSLLKLIPLAGLGFGGFKEDVEIAGETLSGEVNQAFDQANANLAELARIGPIAGAGLGTLTQNARDAATAQGELVATTDEVTLSLHRELDATLALADPTFALINAVRGNEEAHHDLAAANAEVRRLEEQGKEGTKAYADALKEQEDAALAAAQAQLDVAGAARALQQAIDDGDASRKEINQDLTDIGKAAGLSGDQIQRLKDDVRSGLSVAAALARQLAPEVGAAMMEGIRLGITTRSELISVAAADAVHDAMTAARHAAGAESPSKVMRELGVDMMIGLANGISDAEQKAIDAARKGIEKLIDQVGSALDKIKGKAKSFADSIRSGFSGFLDIGGQFGGETFGTDIGGILQSQVGGAQQLAAVLQTLKIQGASQATLAQVAGAGTEFGQALLQGGPSLVDSMNVSLKQISDFANQTGTGLSESFFGDKIDKIQNKLDQLHDDLRELNALEREGHSHDIIMDGEKVAEGTRKQLIRTGGRNPDIFGGRA